MRVYGCKVSRDAALPSQKNPYHIVMHVIVGDCFPVLCQCTVNVMRTHLLEYVLA